MLRSNSVSSHTARFQVDRSIVQVRFRAMRGLVNSATGLVVFLSSAIYSIGAPPTFQGLGDLPGGNVYSGATGVSDDGLVVIGVSMSLPCSPPAPLTCEQYPWPYEAFRWTANGMVGLGYLATQNGVGHSIALGVSADGSIVVGVSNQSVLFPDQAFRWTNGVMSDLSLGCFQSWGHAVSADNSVVVGYCSTVADGRATRWVNGVKLDLGDLPGGLVLSAARDVTPDGSVIVGPATSDAGQEAFRWVGGVMTGLGDLPGGETYADAFAVSANGQVVVGVGTSGSGYEAFRWEAGSMVGLGDLPGGTAYSWAFDTTADGAIVVGHSNGAMDLQTAFIWDSTHGMRILQDVLTSEFGLNLTGWHLSSARSITPNGRTIVGGGINPAGHGEAWIARLGDPLPPTPGDIDADGDIDLADTAALAAVLVGNPLNPAHASRCDLNDDTNVDGRDIAAFVELILVP